MSLWLSLVLIWLAFGVGGIAGSLLVMDSELIPDDEAVARDEDNVVPLRRYR